MKSLILALLLFSQTTLASCPQPVTYLQQGKPAICSGYLFSPEQEKEVRGKIEQLATSQEIIKKQDEMIRVMDMRFALQVNINKNLREQNDSLQDKSTLERAFWFGLGALAAGSLVYIGQRK
jgi:hypothetical protein